MSAYRHKKRFGQHFLHDEMACHDMIAAIAPSAGESFVEIGPGQGVLTQHLLQSSLLCHVIEIDRDLIQGLKHWPQKNLQITEADALTVDLSSLLKVTPYRLVGNLPYNISTPLLFHCFKHIDAWVDAHFLLQKEVVDRIIAPVGSASYGRLSVMSQFYVEATSVLHVGPESFDPPPKVQSSFVRLVPHKKRLTVSAATLEAVVQRSFHARRKTIYNNLKKWIDHGGFLTLGIDPHLRQQNLSVDAYVRLANYMDEHLIFIKEEK